MPISLVKCLRNVLKTWKADDFWGRGGTTLLHEPGFLVLRPMLRAPICRVFTAEQCVDPGCTGDIVVHRELLRQGQEA